MAVSEHLKKFLSASKYLPFNIKTKLLVFITTNVDLYSPENNGICIFNEVA